MWPNSLTIFCNPHKSKSHHGEKTLNDRRFFSTSCGALVGIISLIGCCHSALADWYISGAQYSCSAVSGTFRLLPYDTSSEAPNPSPDSGFTALSNGTSNLRCDLGKRKLKVQIGVTPPQSHGMCMGIGSINIFSIAADGVELLDKSLPFNWRCTSREDALVKILVRNNGAMVDIERCTIPVSGSDNTQTTPKCAKKSFDVDAIVAANAKIDHQLEDPQTQAKESATRLPPENDLAQVFAGTAPSGSKIPLCAHWSSVFLNSTVSPEKQRYGRIAGAQGERVYIHRTNPQLCQNADDDGCTARAYLLPGDRIAVGFICGAWTNIQYQSRIRSQPPVQGWVETARVYGVNPAITAGTLLKTEQSSQQPPAPGRPLLLAPTEPLQQALATKNSDQIERLITAGVSPDGADKSGAPLAAVIEVGDVSLVQTLIRLGANVNAHPSNFKCRNLTRGVKNQAIFNALHKAGIDLNCRVFGQTQLMSVAGDSRLWAWERISGNLNRNTEHLSDPLLLAKRLLSAGADPNAQDDSGKTALFYTMEKNNIDVAELLMDSGANPNISIDTFDGSAAQQSGSTPLMAAFYSYSLTNDPTMFRLLLARGADPNYRNTSRYDSDWDETTTGAVTFAGQTVLTRAAADGYYTLVRLLLETGADPTIPRQDGALPEAIATNNQYPKIAALIADYVKKRQLKLAPEKSGTP